jgi:hypothetical protein
VTDTTTERMIPDSITVGTDLVAFGSPQACTIVAPGGRHWSGRMRRYRRWILDYLGVPAPLVTEFKT